MWEVKSGQRLLSQAFMRTIKLALSLYTEFTIKCCALKLRKKLSDILVVDLGGCERGFFWGKYVVSVVHSW